MSFYKLDPAKWDFGTADLTLEEEAAYLRIVNAMHKHEDGVPDNDRVLAGMFRTSTRKARALVNSLIAAGKLEIEDGKIWNDRARSDLVQRGFTSVSRAESGAKGGRKRAENAANALKENDPHQASASTREEKRREENIGGGGSACAREAAGVQAADLTEREQILEAMGLSPSGVTQSGRFVGGQGDMAEVKRWSALGLTHAQQLTAIREAMAGKRDGAPSSFRYFTPIMARLAGDLARPELVPAAADQRPTAAAKPRAWTLDHTQFNDDGSLRQ